MDYKAAVYQIIQKIPQDKVMTYGQIAELLGDKHLSRVVGNLLHMNPDPDGVPCFRVVNGRGQLAEHFGDGGQEGQKRRMEAAGLEVETKGDKYYVNLERYLWDCKVPYLSLNQYLRKNYGRKLYKVSLDGGFTCPNRDGSLGTKGCIFCSAGGSGDFAQDAGLSITEQIERGKGLIWQKLSGSKRIENISFDSQKSEDTDSGNAELRNTPSEKSLIAYFQAFTGTYGPIEELRAKYEEAISHPEVAILSIATRPDCLSEEVLTLLEELNREKEVWVELGLQTIHEETAEYIRRGYPLSIYEEAVKQLKQRGIKVITHVILGLPGETKKQMLETVQYVGNIGSHGIKLQLLHVLRGTDLEKDYQEGRFQTLEMEEYLDLVRSCIAILPKSMVIHRMTGDGDKKILLAPLWSGDKKRVINELRKRVVEYE